MRRGIPLRTSAALLSLLTTVACFSSKPKRSARAESSQSIAAILQRSGRKRKRAPLVDSDLLRFLSENEQRANERISVDQLLASEGRASHTLNNLLPIEESAFGFTPFRLLEESDWLQQYRRPNVEQLLEKAGNETASECAKILETAAVTREARRRVRCYLKTRNEAWDSGSNATVVTASDEVFATKATSNNSDNLRHVVNLFLSYGLTPRDIAEIMIHSPGVAFMSPTNSSSTTGESLQSTIERVYVELLLGRTEPHHLKLRKYDARKVLRNTPGLLSLTGSNAAIEMVVLLTRMGASANSLSRDKNALPVLLSRQPSAVFRLIAFLASDAVRMPVDKIGPLLRREACQDLLDAVAPGVVNRRHQSAGSLAAQVQREVVHDTYRRMSETALILRYEIGTEDLGKVIAAYPSVLLLSAQRQILPVATFLMEELGIWEDDLPLVLQLYPALLRLDVEQMRNVVSYLKSLEVAQDSLASIFRSFPVVLTLNVQYDMEPVVAFLRSVGVYNVGRFITRLPPVLGYSVENELRPKFDFLATYVTDPRFEVSKFPAFFSYPFERVIKTRFEYLRTVKGFPTALLSLERVLCNGDKDFAVKVARDTDNGAAFAQFSEERKQSLGGFRGRKTRRPQRSHKSRRSKPPKHSSPHPIRSAPNKEIS